MVRGPGALELETNDSAYVMTGSPTFLSCFWASLVAQLVKNPPATWETWVRHLGWEDPLENGTATHSSILAWRIPWTIQSVGVAKSRTRLSAFHFSSCFWSISLAHCHHHVRPAAWPPRMAGQCISKGTVPLSCAVHKLNNHTQGPIHAGGTGGAKVDFSERTFTVYS